MERERVSGPAPPSSAATWMLSFQLDSDVVGVLDACSGARATVKVLADVPRQGALSKRIGRAERVARLHNLSADVLIANVAAPVREQKPRARARTVARVLLVRDCGSLSDPASVLLLWSPAPSARCHRTIAGVARQASALGASR
jgi:hypothetical protein